MIRSAFPRFYTAFSSRFLISSLLLTGCLSSINAFATSASSNSNQSAKVSFGDVGGSVSGFSGNGTTGYADAMVPVFGRVDNFFYLDPQFLYHNSDNYAGALGIGKRWLKSPRTGILGAYVFADYNHSPSGHGFWFISPGVERLGDTVDVSANVYIPVGSQTYDTGTYYANQLGIYDYIYFQGNSQYDELFDTNESVGVGADAEVGFRLPFRNNPKLYLGTYYFSPKNADDYVSERHL